MLFEKNELPHPFGCSKAMANPYGKHDQFSVTVGEAVYGFSSAFLNTDATKINLTLEDGVFIKYNQEVTVSYKAGDVTAADGSLLSSFTNYPVDNNTRNRPSGGGGGGGAATLVIGKVNPPDVTMGNTYTHTFTAGGGSKPYTFAVTDGALPEGLSLAENGTLSGTPAAAGTYNYTVTVTDHAGRTSSHAFTQVIKDGSGSGPAKWRVIILTVDSLEATVDGRPYTLDAAPYVKPGVDRALVPIRFVSEAMGAQVDWIAADRQVFIKDAGKEIVLTIGSKDVLIDGKKQTIDCPAEVVPPGRVFVPLRFVGETLGATVAEITEHLRAEPYERTAERQRTAQRIQTPQPEHPGGHPAFGRTPGAGRWVFHHPLWAVPAERKGPGVFTSVESDFQM